ncbi:MAG: ATP-binding cassette domain-containing protein [Clostridia bacterium]|nr:ATP-binding cassette domain-containing protein [Clostridiales bacterium]MDD7165916.1 ATP-binding cassette domain-containing protein [Clostridia bacterium]MDY2901645.1 ATP-binding cassette domain-containing protein [Christensenellaceae bacterium]
MLELRNICYSAENDGVKKDIIKNVSLKLNEKFIAFTGPNGGGKSTLAKIIMGIIRPTSGQIIFDGKDVTDLSVTDRAKAGIAFAFQQPVKFKGITVTDLIEIASGRKLSVSEICGYLSEVGLCAREYVDREINASLSGGELKRIEIAVTLARKSKFTIFDEPEAGIDLWSFNSLIRVFENLAAKTAESLLIISHQERILSIADRIIVISDGEVTKDGKGSDVLPGILSASSTCNVLKDKTKEAVL